MEYTSQFICGNDGDALEISNDAASGVYAPARWLIEALGGRKSDAGVQVNGYTSLTHCPLWQGVNIIAGDFGQTPVKLLRNDFDEQRRHPAWNLLRVRPNSLQSPSVWKETMMQWALVWGNGVSWIRRQGSRPVELIPLRPDCLSYELVAFEDAQYLVYKYQSPYTYIRYNFLPDEVIHFQGITSDGVWGYPLHEIAKNTIGHGLALEKHGNRQFANGARPGGVLKHPGKPSADARANLREEWEKIHSGPDNSGKIAILSEAMEYQSIAQTNIDAQWIDAKKIGVYEAASLLNLPPHKLGAMQDSSVRANLEEQNADYVQRSLARWYNRADEEYRRKLLTEMEWLSDIYQFKHDASAFLRGDLDTLTTVADRCVKAELMNRNEGRALIGLPPYEGGDKFGSPAINPGPADGQASPDNGRPRNSADDAHVRLLTDRLEHLLEREQLSIEQAAKTSKLFTAWADDFYLDEPPKFVALADSVIGSSIAAAKSVGFVLEVGAVLRDYAKKRHQLLLEVCGGVKRQDLVAAVKQLGEKDRQFSVESLKQAILGG